MPVRTRISDADKTRMAGKAPRPKRNRTGRVKIRIRPGIIIAAEPGKRLTALISSRFFFISLALKIGDGYDFSSIPRLINC
jgi:hypothetical protein